VNNPHRKSSYSTSLRDKLCSEISQDDIGNNIKLCGWVNSIREHGGINFIDIRDRSGIIQVVIPPEVCRKKIFKLETLISIFGKVVLRPEDMINDNIKSGKYEIEVSLLELISDTAHLPFLPEEDVKASIELRLKHRYIDLRRPNMLDNIITRHNTMQTIREFLSSKGFLEIETPYLTAPTPEGARDYIVPSRIHRGKFYALAQSPQMYKQILMVSGIDRYYQFARCFRDEDLRADRQPEHTQIDIEMSFVTEDDVLKLAEDLMCTIFKDVMNIEIPKPFPKITYREAIKYYGSDKPDLRYDLKIIEITEYAKNTEMRILNQSSCSRALFIEDRLFSRKEIKEYENLVKEYGAGGLLWVKIENNNITGPLAKYLNENITKTLNPEDKDGTAFIVSGDQNIVSKSLGILRQHIAIKENLISNNWSFIWVVDFPLFEHDDLGNLIPCHHIFTMPKSEDIHLLDSDPQQVRGYQYDLVLNGVELASGSIRNHLPELQEKLFKIIGLSTEQIKTRFGFLLEAFKYGAPPHGGIAPGLDRIVMLMTKMAAITDVIAFPKTLQATGLMEECPREVETELLDDLKIEVKDTKDEN